ncbi:O-antigen polymerase [Paenibacillus cellulosilyticus]|nr:O-antigen polymerase [Paenibacillus cellulosilyticus]
MEFSIRKSTKTDIIIKTYSVLLLGTILFSILSFNKMPVSTVLLVSIITMFFLGIIFFSKNMFNPFCFLFIYSFLGYIDVTMVSAGIRNSISMVPHYIYDKTLLIMLIWFVTFTIGYGIAYFIIKGRGIKSDVKRNEIKINPWIIFLMCTGIFLFSLISSLKNSLELGGIINGMSGGGAAFADQGYLLALLGFAGCIPVMALYSGKKKRAIIYLLIVFVGIILTGRRSLAILAAFLPYIVYRNEMVRRVKLSKIIILAVPLIIIIMYIGAIRTAGDANFSKTNTNNTLVSELAVLSRYNGYGDNIPALVYKLDSGALNYQKYENAFRGIEYFVPRSLWPEKPLVHSSEIVSNKIFRVGDTGRPVNAYGWAYFHFGIFGVVLSGMLTGLIVCGFYLYVLNKKNVIGLCMYALLILPMLEIFQPESQMKIILFALILKVLDVISRKTTKNSILIS